MSIKHVTGNLLDFDNWNCLFHSCNGQGKMGAGIALQIKNEYPEAYQAYLKDCKFGAITIYTNNLGKTIINAVTQEFYGNDGKRYVDYEILYQLLEITKENLEIKNKQGKNYKLGIPKNLSCGLAGGSWKIVLAMIEEIFENSELEVWIVEYIGKK